MLILFEINVYVNVNFYVDNWIKTDDSTYVTIMLIKNNKDKC